MLSQLVCYFIQDFKLDPPIVLWFGPWHHFHHICHIHQFPHAYLRQRREELDLHFLKLSSEPPTNMWSYDTNHNKPVCSIFNILSLSLSCSFSERLTWCGSQLPKIKWWDYNILRVPMPHYDFSKPLSSWVSSCCSLKQGQEWYFPRWLWEWVCVGVWGGSVRGNAVHFA